MTSFADNPATRITFRLLFSPDAILTDDRGTSKNFARNSMQASLARPSTGGAVSPTFSASPSSPTMPFLFARGCTFTAKLTPALPSWTGIMRSQSGFPLCSSVPSVVKVSLSPRKSPSPPAHKSIPLRSPLRNHATSPSKAPPCQPPAKPARQSDRAIRATS